MKVLFDKIRHHVMKRCVLHISLLCFLLLVAGVFVFNDLYNAFLIISIFLNAFSFASLISFKRGHIPFFSRDTTWDTLKLFKKEEKYEAVNLNLACILLIFAYPTSAVGISWQIIEIIING